MRTRRLDMCNGPIAIPMLRYAIPIFLAGLLQRFFVAADMILAGQLGTSGSDAVAAVGSTTVLTGMLIGFFIGCSSGSAVAVSHALGGKNDKLAQQTVHAAMLLSIVLGTAILRTTGDTKKPMYFLLVSCPVTLLLTVLFVSVMKMDVAGLALATTLAELILFRVIIKKKVAALPAAP